MNKILYSSLVALGLAALGHGQSFGTPYPIHISTLHPTDSASNYLVRDGAGGAYFIGRYANPKNGYIMWGHVDRNNAGPTPYSMFFSGNTDQVQGMAVYGGKFYAILKTSSSTYSVYLLDGATPRLLGSFTPRGGYCGIASGSQHVYLFNSDPLGNANPVTDLYTADTVALHYYATLNMGTNSMAVINDLTLPYDYQTCWGGYIDANNNSYAKVGIASPSIVPAAIVRTPFNGVGAISTADHAATDQNQAVAFGEAVTWNGQSGLIQPTNYAFRMNNGGLDATAGPTLDGYFPTNQYDQSNIGDKALPVAQAAWYDGAAGVYLACGTCGAGISPQWNAWIATLSTLPTLAWNVPPVEPLYVPQQPTPLPPCQYTATNSLWGYFANNPTFGTAYIFTFDRNGNQGTTLSLPAGLVCQLIASDDSHAFVMNTDTIYVINP